MEKYGGCFQVYQFVLKQNPPPWKQNINTRALMICPNLSKSRLFPGFLIYIIPLLLSHLASNAVHALSFWTTRTGMAASSGEHQWCHQSEQYSNPSPSKEKHRHLPNYIAWQARSPVLVIQLDWLGKMRHRIGQCFFFSLLDHVSLFISIIELLIFTSTPCRAVFVSRLEAKKE